MRIGDKGAMGRILIRDEFGNGIVDELAPLPVSAPSSDIVNSFMLSASACCMTSLSTVTYTNYIAR